MSTSPDRLCAALSDRYRIERELGAGGMATVYLADDVRHRRKVALKVLRPELAAVIGAERFLKEIETTANLQHAHILPLHDSGAVDGTVFYVMPFVEGESLRDRLTRERQLPINDALRIAQEVASALDYAHRKGVIHRDIKPENILLHEGQALVADFGIALAASRTEGGTRMTETGMSLGTPHYMSPEQAMGERTLDARTDIYALGCVVYEMLAGEPPHSGPTAQAIVAKVLTDEPRPLTELRKSVPEHVDSAVLTALSKLPADRFTSAAEFAAALQGAVTVTRARVSRGAATARTSRRNQVILGGAIIMALLAGWFGHALLRPSTPPNVVRLSVPVPEGITVGVAGGESPDLAMAPDGRTVAYVSNGQLWVRRLDEADAKVIAGADGALTPFFSPDGRNVGFGLDRLLRWSSVDGGAVTAIAGSQIGYLAGASWDEQNRVVYEGDAGIAGLRRIPIGGGEPEQLTSVTLAGEAYHKWPQSIGDGRLVLFTALGPSGQWHDSKIVLLDTESGERTVVREKATFGRYVPTGHVLFVEETGALAALPFDLKRRRSNGAVFAVEPGVRVGAWGGSAMYAVANDGTLAIVRGTALRDEQLWWFDRSGRRLRPIGPPTVGYQSALSPNGRSIATVTHRAGDEGVSVIDGESGQSELVTLGPAAEWAPIWSPDGKSLAYSQSSPTGSSIQVQDVASGGEQRQLFAAPRGQEIWVNDWSRDGAWILMTESGPRGLDLRAIKADGSGDSIVVAATPLGEDRGRFSPDGNWVAYRGGTDTYLVSFPDLRRRFQIAAGHTPRWTKGGSELVFLRGDSLFAMAMAADPRTRETPRLLFVVDDLGVFDDYDVTPDGERIVLRLPNTVAYARGIDIVLNGFSEAGARSQSPQ